MKQKVYYAWKKTNKFWHLEWCLCDMYCSCASKFSQYGDIHLSEVCEGKTYVQRILSRSRQFQAYNRSNAMDPMFSVWVGMDWRHDMLMRTGIRVLMDPNSITRAIFWKYDANCWDWTFKQLELEEV